MWHACYREYHDAAYKPHYENGDAKSAAVALMEGAMTNIAMMVGGWIRVRFAQGNFNADNCLVGGRTMDYGPFGFLDAYVSWHLHASNTFVVFWFLRFSLWGPSTSFFSFYENLISKRTALFSLLKYPFGSIPWRRNGPDPAITLAS